MTPAELLDLVSSGLRGELSPRGRILTALAPALVASAYFAGGLGVFAIRSAVRGLQQDAETRTRGKSVLVGFFLRHYFFWLLAPFWRLLLWTGLPANAITALSALLGVAAAVAVAAGRFSLGGWLFLVSGMLDSFDGRLARVRGEAGPAGNALDSVLDRYSDGVYLIGLAWYYRESWVLLAVLFAFLGTSVVPYVRAKAESLGVPLRGGVMQRVERVLFLGGTVALSPVLEAIVDPTNPHPAHWLAIGGIAIVALLSNVTGVTRLVALLRALLPAGAPGRRLFPAELSWNAAAAAAATGADFALVLALVQLAGLSGAVATATGCVLGAAVNFGLNRALTFRSRGALAGQAGRYALVSATSALLNAGGVALLSSHPGVDFRLGWWVVRGSVWLLWNYPLQRGYVFAPREPSRPAADEGPALEGPRAA